MVDRGRDAGISLPDHHVFRQFSCLELTITVPTSHMIGRYWHVAFAQPCEYWKDRVYKTDKETRTNRDGIDEHRHGPNKPNK